jgi:hypothetical protein
MKAVKNVQETTSEPPRRKRLGFSDILLIITSAGSLILSIISIKYTDRTMQEAEKWKKAEFLAAQFEKFSKDPSVILVTRLHEWFERNVYLDNRAEIINLDYVSIALDNAEQQYTADATLVDPKKQFIGDAYDDYFNWLSLFHRYHNSGLYSAEDLKPYLEHQLNSLAFKEGDDEHIKLFKESLWSFIKRRNYQEVANLCNCYHLKTSPGNDRRVARN